MKQYQDMLKYILANGQATDDRTGVGTISVFGYQNRFNLEEGFPLVTTKKVHFKSIVEELLWFLRGETNVKSLQEKGVTIWDEWADENGELGPVYGKQWRKWNATKVLTNEFGHVKIENKSIDQIANLITEIKSKPTSRRMMVSAWNPADVSEVRLPWCHAFAQFNVKKGKLSCHMYQRSADSFLGVPYNIASYALLTHMIAQVCDLCVGEFIHSYGDLHVYKNHIEQVELQLSREPKPLPKLFLSPGINDIDKFQFEDVVLLNYDPHPAIKAPVAV